MHFNRARQLANVFRFIDDLTAINDDGEYEHIDKEIYPPEFELKKENSGNTEGLFLYFFIKIKSKKFSMNLFYKRDAFPFSSIRMPHLTNYIPSKMFYVTYEVEIAIRISRVTSSKTNFINHCSALFFHNG